MFLGTSLRRAINPRRLKLTCWKYLESKLDDAEQVQSKLDDAEQVQNWFCADH